MAAGREVAGQPRQTRTEAVIADALGEAGEGDLAAAGAAPAVGAVFGDDRGQRRDLHDLVPSRLRVSGPCVGGQARAAGAAGVGQVVDDLVDTLGRQELAVVSGVAGASAGLAAAALLAVSELGLQVQRVGTGGLGRVAGVLIEAGLDASEKALKKKKP